MKLLIALLLLSGCGAAKPVKEPAPLAKLPITTAAEQTQLYFPTLLKEKVALVVNQTSMVGDKHLVDTLVTSGINVVAIFSPEHGFRGSADAGEHVNDTIDTKTGVKIISLYGSKKQPTTKDLEGITMILFDIQDVGARFYTYISTLHYLMETSTELNIPLMVLDRPNPNGWYVDGPVLQPDQKSFVGVDPIPVVHGLTVGEYAKMVNGENWLGNSKQCKLTVIPCANYSHTMRYELPVKPSPNLPNAKAVYWYPSLCFFEGTVVSVGRGTDLPFQVFGAENVTMDNAYEFTPTSKPGAKSPPSLGKKCSGKNLSTEDISKQPGRIHLEFLLMMYKASNDKEHFFLKNNFIDKLAGNTQLRKQVIDGLSAEEISATWQKDLNVYKLMRKKYLLYPDFE